MFLSYSSLDSDYATELQSVLEQAGLKVFRDRNHLELGSRFDPSIRNALLSAHEIVILCSPSSIASDWVKRELGAAWALGKAVTPVVLHMEIDNLPSELRDRQASYFEEMVRDRTGWRFISEFKQRNML